MATGRVSAAVGATGANGATGVALLDAIFLGAIWLDLERATGSFGVAATGMAMGAGELADAVAGTLSAGMAPLGVGDGVGAERICTRATPMASVVAPKAPTAAHNQRLGAVGTLPDGYRGRVDIGVFLDEPLQRSKPTIGPQAMGPNGCQCVTGRKPKAAYVPQIQKR